MAAAVRARGTRVHLIEGGTVGARLLSGDIASVATDLGPSGQTFVLAPGTVVPYLLHRSGDVGVYVFRARRAGEDGDQPLTRLPGVSDPVRLFLFSGRRGTALRVRNFFRKLTRYGHDPSDLSDAFWTRAAGALTARRRPHVRLLGFLLAQEATYQADRLRARGGGPGDGGVRAAGVVRDSELHAELADGRVLAPAGTSRRARRLG